VRYIQAGKLNQPTVGGIIDFVIIVKEKFNWIITQGFKNNNNEIFE